MEEALPHKVFSLLLFYLSRFKDWTLSNLLSLQCGLEPSLNIFNILDGVDWKYKLSCVRKNFSFNKMNLGCHCILPEYLGSLFRKKKNTVHSCYIWMVICMCSWVSVNDFYVWKWLVMSGFLLAGCIMRILGILVVLCIVRITQHLSSFEEKLPPL